MRYCLYARKSSEDDERQALSIDSQINEMTTVAKRDDLNITEIRRESHSAKDSGQRPVFKQLMADIRSGMFTGIVTWAPDRLSRNAGDLGSLVDLMDQGLLKEIRTPGQRFTNSPNEKFLLMILCSQAKLENDNRGVNVKRGLKNKCEMGICPGVAPLGYLNERSPDRNKGKIIVDPVRAPFIKQMFEKVAADGLSGRDLYRWIFDAGFRTRIGKRVTLSMVYKIFHNAFYTGHFEYPVGGGAWYKGRYEPLISQQLFDDVQRILSTGQEREWGTHDFAFTRLMTCGHCGSGVTADEKHKVMKNGSVKRYVYYRCTHSRNLACHAPGIREEDLIEQIIDILDGLSLNKSAVKRKIDDEFERFSRFASDVLGVTDKQKAQKINQRKYVEYLLTSGTMTEKRELIGCLKNRLMLKEQRIALLPHVETAQKAIALE
ncbi:MAG: recombinase family protein [Candidatus Peregrinibacteria bacterium]